MKIFQKGLYTLFLISLLIAGRSAAASISPDLQKAIEKTKSTDKMLPIIVVVKTPAVMLNEHYQPKERSELILKKQQASRESQSGILKFLAEKKNMGKVDHIRSFWINNSISMNATPDLVRQLGKRGDVEEITTEKAVIIQQEKIEKKIKADQKKQKEAEE